MRGVRREEDEETKRLNDLETFDTEHRLSHIIHNTLTDCQLLTANCQLCAKGH